MRPMPLKSARRACAIVLALCYIWLSAAGTFLHDCARVPVSSSSQVCASMTQTETHLAEDSHAISHALGTHVCSVCEWEAVNVSPALPVFEVLPSFTLQQRVVTTFPRYLKTVSISTSSRAPPHA